jgi:uncharacterized membrane protein
MEAYLYVLLRLVHIAAGVFWAGGAIFIALLLTPAVRAAGPDGGKVMQQLTLTAKMPLVMTVAAVLTTLSGLVLYWPASGGFNVDWVLSPAGMTLTLGGLAGLATLILGLTVQAPSSRRLAALAGEIRAAGGPPSKEHLAELHRLQARLGTGGMWVAALLAVAVVGMATFRYLPS